MTTGIQTILIGSYANDGTGDDLRTAFTKVNNNFAFLNTEVSISSVTSLGSGTTLFADKNGINLEFKTLTSTDNSINITNTSTTVNLQGVTKLNTDSSPQLIANLNLNTHYIYGGDTQTTIYGQDPTISAGLFAAMVPNSTLIADFGSITYPTGYQTNSRGYNVDLNGSGVISGILTPPTNDYDFGTFGNTALAVGGKYLTLGVNLTTAGVNNITLTSTGITNVTLPTSGTLATTTSTLNQFANTSSAQLAAVLTDATGTGYAVFSASPTLTGTLTGNNISLGGYLYASGNFAINGNKFEVDATTGNVTFQDGTVQNTAWPSTSGTRASNATGTPGQISWDTNYIYICTATNTWKRSPLTGGY
jgi:hypothetical protein